VPHNDDAVEDQQIMAGDTHNAVSDHFFGTAEKTFQESSYVVDSQNKPFNQDDLWQKMGDYSIYEEMKMDDQVNVALQLKKDLIVGSGWKIIPQDEGQTEIAEDITSRLQEDPAVAFEDQMEELIDGSYSFGFALSEKLFKFRDDNSLTWNEMKTRHPNSWLIHTDPHGNVENYQQRGVTGDINVNPKSLIHYINKRAFQNPYGTSDLRAAHDAWLVKRHIIRYYSIFLEKHASPTPVGKYKKNVPNSKIAELFNILKKFQAKTAMVIPEEFEIDFLESKTNGEAYIKGSNLFRGSTLAMYPLPVPSFIPCALMFYPYTALTKYPAILTNTSLSFVFKLSHLPCDVIILRPFITTVDCFGTSCSKIPPVTTMESTASASNIVTVASLTPTFLFANIMMSVITNCFPI